MQKKIPISIGILAWKSGETLINTLLSYHNTGILELVEDVKILFQECSLDDIAIAKHFSLEYLPLKDNIGIGKAFIKLTEKAKCDKVMILEHDWINIEDISNTITRISSGIDMIDRGYDCIRYRHRKEPGNPHFSFQYKGRELDYYDEEIECTSPHLLDSLHWLDPSEAFPDKIKKEGEYFVTTSRWGNWTNNPCMYKKQFYLDIVEPFVGEGIDLEGNISKWWAQQNYKVAHGEGLFKHCDMKKYKL